MILRELFDRLFERLAAVDHVTSSRNASANDCRIYASFGKILLAKRYLRRAGFNCPSDSSNCAYKCATCGDARRIFTSLKISEEYSTFSVAPKFARDRFGVRLVHVVRAQLQNSSRFFDVASSEFAFGPRV